MDTTKFSYIIGEPQNGCVSSIRFFGRITPERAASFNAEFDYLETAVRPSLIRVLINCEGGSVLHGMSVYSTIQNSRIPTECIIEGIAASMGSILWAAGNKSLMRDYSILMVHNPFQPGETGKEPSDLVKAFIKQVETIYRKRFGLKAEHVRNIMNGKADKDGTFFDALSAVRNGIIPLENILHTSRQIRDKVKSELTGMEDTVEIQSLMSRISAELPEEPGCKPMGETAPILNQTNHTIMNTEKTNSAEYAAVVASLGFKDNYEVQDVMTRITSLVSVEARLKDTEKSLADAQTVIAGKDAAITNLQKDLTAATASLSTYQQKESLEKKTRNEAMIEAAIQAGKISRESKEGWMAMAENNPSLVESTLTSIPEREQISKEIANDPANIRAAANATKTAEEKMAEKVNEVVGENFEFKKLK